MSPVPYEGCITAIPYIAPIHGRRIVRYTDTHGVNRSTSLARYLMSLHLGHIPSPDQDVDHIDQDHLNDRISNLQLVSKVANISKGSLKNATHYMIHATCVVCGAPVYKQGRIHYHPDGTIFSCSRSCAGHISHLRETESLDSLKLRNNATDVVMLRQCVPITDCVRIDTPSPALLSVLEILLSYGHDYYPEGAALISK